MFIFTVKYNVSFTTHLLFWAYSSWIIMDCSYYQYDLTGSLLPFVYIQANTKLFESIYHLPLSSNVTYPKYKKLKIPTYPK